MIYKDDEGGGGGGGGPLLDWCWVDVNWSFTEPKPLNLLQGFEVVVYSGTDPTDTANYIIPPQQVLPADRRLVTGFEIPMGTTPAPTVKAAVRTLYPLGKGAWVPVGASTTAVQGGLQAVANDNLMPNPTSELGLALMGYGSTLVVNDAGNAYQGNYCRKLDASATNQTALTPRIPCSYGDQVAFDGMMKTSNTSVAGRLVIKFFNSAGTVVGTSTSTPISSTTYTSTNVTSAFRAAAPTTAVNFQAFIEASTTAASQWVYFDNITLRRAVTSKVMGADEGFRVINALKNSGSSTTDVVWPSINNDPNVNGGAPVLVDPLWARSTAYTVGQRVCAGDVSGGTYPLSYANALRVYECTTAGTSASTGQGPSGSNPATDSVTDGTAKWKCVGWMWGAGATPGCKPWARTTVYTAGDLVCGDPGATNPGYSGEYGKIYGNPEGDRFNPSGTLLNYGGTRIYRCVTGGTSTNTGNGPTGQGTGITDGTCVWDYFGENTGSEERLQIWHLQTSSDATTYGAYSYEFRIQPKTAKDNLDALTHATVELLKSDNTVTTRASITTNIPYSVAMPSRKYFTPGTANSIKNCTRTMFHTGMIPAISYIGSTPFAATLRLRVRLSNSFGESDARDYALWNNTNCQPAPLSGSFSGTLGTPPTGGGGGGGGGCPAPETLVDVWVDGVEAQKPAGEIQPGDLVVTYHAATDTRGIWPVLQVRRLEEEPRWRVRFEDGFEAVVSRYHRYFRTDGTQAEACWLRPGEVIDGDVPRVVADSQECEAGPVMAITIDQAHTYQTSGLLQSNLKPM